MSDPSTEDINDEAESEIPSTELPTTESDLKTENTTSSTIATASTASNANDGSNETSNSPDGSASASGSSSSVKKSTEDTSGSSGSKDSSSPTGDSSGTGTGESGEGGSDDADKPPEDEQAEEPPPQEEPPDEPPPPPPRPKKKKQPAAQPAADNGEVDAAGDISMQYEKKFKDILRRRRQEEEKANEAKSRNKPTIDELNSYFKAWVLSDFEKERDKPKSNEKAKKRKQEEVRQKKAQEAFCTWLRYKKQQLKMERRRWRLQCKERRQLVQKRSRAVSEAAYQDWLASKRQQRCESGRRSSAAPPVVYTRDMSALQARSYRANLGGPGGGRRCSSAAARMQSDEVYNVENVYCPEHKTEYRLETKRTSSGSCYRLTSVRKLDM